MQRALKATYFQQLRRISGFAEQTRLERCSKPEVSPEEVQSILGLREQIVNFNSRNSRVRQVHSNLLPSNNPTEDRRSLCQSRSANGHSIMSGVFDGHAGPWCAQLASERLFYYIHLACLSNEDIEKMLDLYYSNKPLPSNPNFFRTAHEPTLSVTYANADFLKKLMSFGEKLISDLETQRRSPTESIFLAAVQLDKDLLSDALEPDCDPWMIRAAVSGAVSCFTYIQQQHLYVGNIGDAAGLLIQNNGSKWQPKKMSSVHSGQNQREVQRVLSNHPKNESRSVLRNQRLLGYLSPLRAFGDCRFKMTLSELTSLEDRNLDLDNDGQPDKLVLPFYRTPPYLSAKPQIRYHRLGVTDRAIVLASDGLWDVLGHSDVAQLIGAYLDRDPEVFEANAATMLIRRAIGEGWDGYDEMEVRRSLAHSPEESRMYRDDITVQVLFL